MPGVIRSLRQLDVRLPDDLLLMDYDVVKSFSIRPFAVINILRIDSEESCFNLLLTRIEYGEGVDGPPVFMEVKSELVVLPSTTVPRSSPLVFGMVISRIYRLDTLERISSKKRLRRLNKTWMQRS